MEPIGLLTSIASARCDEFQSTIIAKCSDDLIVATSRYDIPTDLVESEDGEDLVKFHFQLHGSACYSVSGHPDLIVDGASSVFGFHGRGVSKRGHMAAGAGFALTVLCRPQALIDRFGIERAELPTSILRNLDEGHSEWFAEAARLTPEMIIALRALEASPLRGAMLQRYVEARGIELLCELWPQIARRASRPASMDERLRAKVDRTRAHIDSAFAEPLAMQRLARDAATNQTKLAQAFREAYGMTVFEYVRSRRMEEARKLLRAGSLSITEIAFEVGYEHSCNFSVAYKRHFGVTPREDRSALRH